MKDLTPHKRFYFARRREEEEAEGDKVRRRTVAEKIESEEAGGR